MELTNPIFLCKVFSDRVADTCVACDQGGFLRELLFFISGGHCHDKTVFDISSTDFLFGTR